MGQTPRQKRESTYRSVWFGTVLLTSLYLWAGKSWVVLGLFWIAALVAWPALLHRTVCDVQNKSNGKPCANDAYGILRACTRREHQRAKRDALFALFGMVNPGRRYRIMWARSDVEHGRATPTPRNPAQEVTRPMYDATMLFATVGSFIVAATALMVQVLTSPALT